MKKWLIRYITTDDDTSKCWVEAYNKEDAKVQVRREYWDVKEIISVSEMS